MVTLSPNFSTTNNDRTITCKISIVAVFNKNFDNKINRNSLYCIPYIILEGTTEYYEKPKNYKNMNLNGIKIELFR